MRLGSTGGDSTTSPEPATLVLSVLAGPPMDPARLAPKRAYVVGRSSQCDVQLKDQCISRTHAFLECRGGRWFIEDKGSRIGTRLNSLDLQAERPTPLAEGDTLVFGPWSLRVHLGGSTAILADPSPPTHTSETDGLIEKLDTGQLAQLAQQRLSLLLEFAAAIQDAPDAEALARTVAGVAAKGTGHRRAALVTPTGGPERVRVIASVVDGVSARAAFPISRSLLRAASGGLVRLSGDFSLRQAQSIVSHGISSALCAPVMVGSAPVAYVYVDNGDQPHPDQADAASFLAAVAHLAGLAQAAIDRRSLEDRQRELEADLTAARLAQRRLMPPPRGRVGPVGYAVENLPGRLVAGDLFDIVELPGGRVAFFLGDVAGKGVGAAVLMAAAQTLMRAALRSGAGLADAVSAVNREMVQRSASGEFISLFAGLVSPDERCLRYVDAGHGYWLHRPSGHLPGRITGEGGIVLGLDPDAEYPEERVPLGPGDRVVVFSDGVPEQRDPSGAAAFGFAGAIEALAQSAAEGDDVSGLVARLRAFAGGDALADDVTIASIRFDPA